MILFVLFLNLICFIWNVLSFGDNFDRENYIHAVIFIMVAAGNFYVVTLMLGILIKKNIQPVNLTEE